MNLSPELQKQIADFLTSLPGIHDVDSQRVLLYQAGLDSQLQAHIPFGKPPAQFFPLLVLTLANYGKLHDGRYALEATLGAAKNYIGQDRQEYCDVLLRKLHVAIEKEQSHVANQSDETLYSISGIKNLQQKREIAFFKGNKNFINRMLFSVIVIGISLLSITIYMIIISRFNEKPENGRSVLPLSESNLSLIPTLVFSYDTNSGWNLKNVGNGPALDIIVAYQQKMSNIWDAPTRIAPLGAGERFNLFWVTSEFKKIGVMYYDTLNNVYYSLCNEGVTRLQKERFFPTWNESDIVQSWQHQQDSPQPIPRSLRRAIRV